jgi:hypothetical protein
MWVWSPVVAGRAWRADGRCWVEVRVGIRVSRMGAEGLIELVSAGDKEDEGLRPW